MVLHSTPGGRSPASVEISSASNQLAKKTPVHELPDPLVLPTSIIGHNRAGDGDAIAGTMSEPASSDRGRPSQMSRRRSHSGSSRRQLSRQPTQPHPIYPVLTPSERIQVSPAATPTYPPLYQSPSATPYDRRNSYVGPYAMPTQPQVTMTPSSPSPFLYNPGFTHPLVREPGLVQQSFHPSYQPMPQSHAHVYQYALHSPEANPAHPAHSPPILAPSPSSGQPTPTTSFGGPPVPLQPFHFPSNPQYTYPPHSFTASPSIYPSQYANLPYKPRFTPQMQPGHEGQGTWWYPSQGPVISASSSQPAFPGHYPFNYPPLSPQETDNFSSGGLTPSIATTQSEFPSSQHSEPQTPGLSSAPSVTTVAVSRPERSITRRHYHPSPPAFRSDWVMWIGNVPSDATREELMLFLSRPLSATPLPPSEREPLTPLTEGGVVSIFLILRSSCAFVNYESEAHLQSAVHRFNGASLRPSETRCPRLVCRVRRKEDDLKAGVGAQRGIGIHTRWIKEMKPTQPDISLISQPLSSPGPYSTAASTPSDQLAVSPSSDGDTARSHQPTRHSSGSGSYASTSSSSLARYFPKRYFILKSLTQYDLDLSVEKGVWATQKHNEGVLDRAFRTAEEVYLIFGVNRSGEFYGFGRMAGQVQQSEQIVSWATRAHNPGSPRSPSRHQRLAKEVDASTSSQSASRPEKESSTSFPSPEHKFVEESPLAFSPSLEPSLKPETRSLHKRLEEDPKRPDMGPGAFHTAPGVLGPPASKLSVAQLEQKYPTDSGRAPVPPPSSPPPPIKMCSPQEFTLDPTAPARAIRPHKRTPDHPSDFIPNSLASVREEGSQPRGGTVQEKELAQSEPVTRQDSWGDAFKVEWICVQPLPFHRTRHLRNPWNHDREVKVSRDGTELEPTVGQALLDEWRRVVGTPPAPSGSRRTPPAVGSSSKRGGTGLSNYPEA